MTAVALVLLALVLVAIGVGAMQLARIAPALVGAIKALPQPPAPIVHVEAPPAPLPLEPPKPEPPGPLLAVDRDTLPTQAGRHLLGVVALAGRRRLAATFTSRPAAGQGGTSGVRIAAELVDSTGAVVAEVRSVAGRHYAPLGQPHGLVLAGLRTPAVGTTFVQGSPRVGWGPLLGAEARFFLELDGSIDWPACERARFEVTA